MNNFVKGTMQRKGAVAASLAASSIAAASIAFIGYAIWLLDRGFDFTDAAFYLMSMQRPADYDFVFGFWPYALHPLYTISGGSISHLQRLCAIAMVVLGGSVGLLSLRRLWPTAGYPTSLAVITTAMAMPFSYYFFWLATPSYNWLALIAGITLILSTLFLIGKSASPIMSAVFATGSAACIFFTRPQGFVAFGIIYGLIILFAFETFKQRAQQIAWTAALSAIVALFIIAALPIQTIHSQITEYFAFFGRDQPALYSFGDQQVTFLASCFLFPIFAVILAARLCFQPNLWVDRLLLAVSSGVLLYLFGRCTFEPNQMNVGRAAATVSIASLCIAYICNQGPVRLIIILAVLSLTAWAATIGTSNPTIFQVQFFFGLSNMIVLIASLLVGRTRSWIPICTCFVLLLATLSVVRNGMAQPYRLATPLAAQMQETELGWGQTLKLDTKTSLFIRSLMEIAERNGFCRGGPAIDLSGVLPGVVFAMGGRMPVFPWIFGGLPISGHLLKVYLRTIDSQTLYRSWLIVSEGTNKFTREQIENDGLDFSRFRLVGDLAYPIDGASVKIYAPTAPTGSCRLSN